MTYETLEYLHSLVEENIKDNDTINQYIIDESLADALSEWGH